MNAARFSLKDKDKGNARMRGERSTARVDSKNDIEVRAHARIDLSNASRNEASLKEIAHEKKSM